MLVFHVPTVDSTKESNVNGMTNRPIYCDAAMTYRLNADSVAAPTVRFAPIRSPSSEQTEKPPYRDGSAGHRTIDDALPHVLVSAHAAAGVSGRTSKAAQPGATTDSKDSTPLPS